MDSIWLCWELTYEYIRANSGFDYYIAYSFFNTQNS